ncbi:PD-(D/E)XK motif protein [Streptosporangium sp. NPDC000563]|uniref:PD-(D/E)XK motif protein n=1 Tax=Streptosporangium sp. NPDC000563 TaxID=3154366 RepID=UPI00331E9CFD
MTSPDRHLSADNFEEFVRRAIPLEHPIPGEPQLILFIDPRRQEIGLRVRATSGEPRLETGLEHVQLRPVQRGVKRFLEIVITDPRLFSDSYPVLCAVADRVQLQGLSLGAALSDTLRILGRLLTRTDTLPVEMELGLFGELMLLLGLSRKLDPEEALQAWRGPEREEHDFGLRGHDIEVKTTGAERRTHWVGSLTQLLPTGDRPLWLISHQLTRADATDGRTLPDLINLVRLSVGDLLPKLDRHLHNAGWRDQFTDTCRNRWRRREPSVIFAVDADFPSLTPMKLNGVPLARIPDVRYRVDLTEQPIGTAGPDFLIEALNHGEIA